MPALAHDKMPKETLQRGGVNYLEFLSAPALQLDRPNTRCHCRSAHIRQLWICCLGPRVQQSGDTLWTECLLFLSLVAFGNDPYFNVRLKCPLK